MADGGRSLQDIAQRLVALRDALGYNQSSFAVLIGTTPSAVSNYEKGVRRPELHVAIKIKIKTGATLDWLYLGDRSGLPGRLLEVLPAPSDPSDAAARR